MNKAMKVSQTSLNTAALRKPFTLLCAVSAAFLMSVSSMNVSAESYDMNHRPMGALKSLDLQEQQKQDISVVLQQTRISNRVYTDKAQMKSQMRDLMNMPVWDATLAQEVLQMSASDQKAIALNRAKAKHKIFNLLSAEQQSELQAKQSEHKTEQNKAKKKMPRRLAKRLDFTDAQEQALDTIKVNTKLKMEAIRADLVAFKDAERALIQSANFDEDAWLTLHAQYTQTLSDAKLIKLEEKYQENAILTDAQKATLKKFRKKMKEKSAKRGLI